MYTHIVFSKKPAKVQINLHMCKNFRNFAAQMEKNTCIFIGLSALLVLLFGLDVCSGSLWLWPLDDLSSMEQQILHAIRLPKALTAILAGASLSMAGLIMQTLFRNPLAGPYTLGVSSGASLGVAFLTMCSALIAEGIGGGFLLPLAAVIGASLVLLLVLAVSRRVDRKSVV